MAVEKPKARCNDPLLAALRGKRYSPLKRHTTRSKKGELQKTEASTPEKLAHLYNWAAVNFPYQALPLDMAAKVVEGSRYKPKKDSARYVAMKGYMSQAKRILVKEYRRGLPFIRDSKDSGKKDYSGYRATVDEADYIIHCLVASQGRVESSKNNLSQNLSDYDRLVDQGGLDTEGEVAKHLEQARRLEQGLSDNKVASFLPSVDAANIRRIKGRSTGTG